MQPFEKIQDYAHTVCTNIRWKKAHAMITEEIENHLTDQRDAYIAQGVNEAAATDQAIAQMGDPMIVGTQLDRTHRPKPQWGMLALTAALLIGGFLIRLLFNEHYIWEQAIITVIGLGLMAAAYFADFTLIGKYPKIIYFSMLGLSAFLVLCSFPYGWLFEHGSFTLLFPLGFAAAVYSAKNKGYPGIVLCGVAGVAFLFLLCVMPMASNSLIFAVSGLAVMCIAISKRWFKVKILYAYLLVFAAVAIVAVWVLANMQGDYRWNRIRVAFDPASDPNGAGFIGTQIKAILNGANLFGPGVISGAAPSASWHGDLTYYLLVLLIYHTGWISLIIVMGLLLYFIIRGFLCCFRQKSGLGLLVSVSIMMTFTMQVIVYVMANLGFQLIASLSLPLVSYTTDESILINLVLIGIMLSVFRTGDIVREKNTNKHRKQNFIECNDGKLIISFNKK
jgi:cell division protein FtsW (lipid II flippase)